MSDKGLWRVTGTPDYPDHLDFHDYPVVLYLLDKVEADKVMLHGEKTLPGRVWDVQRVYISEFDYALHHITTMKEEKEERA